MIRYVVQFVLGVVLVGGAVLLAKKLVDTRPPAPTQVAQPVVPIVRSLLVHPQSVQIDVATHGTVTPRTETMLVAEVAGKVATTSPVLAAGGFFARGDELLAIESREYELAVTAAAAEVAQRRTALAIERAEAPPLVRREPHLAQAEAALAAAEATLQRAQLDLERCSVRAPYDGRVWDKRADVGQYVTVGVPLARIYAVDYAEVRLPIADHELAFLDLPLDYQEAGGPRPGPLVTLRAEFAGEVHEWPARIVRTAGEIDPISRMVQAVARIDQPYARAANGHAARPPLAVGMFVAATVHGRTFPDLFVLPRSVLRPGGTTVLVIKDGRLQERTVDVLRREREHVYVRAGLADGDHVCLTPVEVFSPGMRVEVAEAKQ